MEKVEGEQKKRERKGELQRGGGKAKGKEKSEEGCGGRGGGKQG